MYANASGAPNLRSKKTPPHPLRSKYSAGEQPLSLASSSFSMIKNANTMNPPEPRFRQRRKTDSKTIREQEEIAVKNRIRNSVTGAITMTEIGVGSYQIAQGQKNPLQMIASHAKPKGESADHYYRRLLDPNNPIISRTQYKDLTGIFHKALVLHGIATITGGVSGAIRLSAGLLEGQEDRNAVTILKNHAKTKSEISRRLKELDEIRNTPEYDIVKAQIDREMQRMDEKESAVFRRVKKIRSVATDMNAGAWALGGAAGTLSGAGMLNVAFHRNAVAAATAGFLGRIATPGLVTAIQVASAMYGAGVILANAHSVVNGGLYLRDRLSGKFKSSDNTNILAKRMANGALIGGTGRCLSGAGELMNLMTKTGFPVFATLNWGEVLLNNGGLFAFDKMLTWLQAPAKMIGGAVGINSAVKQLGALRKIKENEKKGIYKVSKEDKALVHEALVNSGNFVNSGLL